MFGPLGADKYREYCTDIHQSGQYLLDVINDILDMSKIEAGRIRLDLEQVELEPLPQRRDARRVGARRRQAARAHRPDRPAASACVADSRLLKQIVLNLLSNAVKFTPEGGRITVRARASSGLGAASPSRIPASAFPRDALAKLGRPFEQVESQLTKSHQGSGLGLAIAKSLTELHGGTMRIRSTPGTGTMVVLRLPMDRTSLRKHEIAEAAA